MAKSSEILDRNRQIVDMARQGLSYEAIGKIFGLKRQRVSQICIENGIIRRPHDVSVELWESQWKEL